jgi:hypothetical protein
LRRLFKLAASIAYECLVRPFYENLKYDCNWLDILVSSIDDRDVEVTIANIAAALKCHDEPPEADEPWIVCPSLLNIEDIVSDMCEGQYADSHQNAARKAKIPPKLWFVDVVLQKNVCPLGHKTQRRDLFLSALYSFYKGFWCSIPEIIWRQIYKFWEGVHHRVAEPTKTWGLPFPFLITHMLRKKGIKGNATDGPIIEHPWFGHIQWNQSCSHMPRAAPEPEMMDMDEPVAPERAAPELVEPPVEPKEEAEDQQEEEEEYEETIMIRASDFAALQDTLEDMRFKIAEIQREAHQDRLDVQINLHSQWYEPLGRIVCKVQDRIHRERSVCL